MADSISAKPIVVIKVGGEVIASPSLIETLTNNIMELQKAQYQCVILHGGGPQIDKLQGALNLPTNKVAGRRITSPADLNIVCQAVCGEANTKLTQALVNRSIKAIGISGASSNCIQATRRPPMVLPEADDITVDFGEVGDITAINGKFIQQLLSIDLTPVIATLGIDVEAKCIFNINGDLAASYVAEALDAHYLLMCTSVGAIFENLPDKNSRINKLTPKIAEKKITQQVIQGGMIPKVRAAFDLLKRTQVAMRVIIIGLDNAHTFSSAIEQLNSPSTDTEQIYGTVLSLT